TTVTVFGPYSHAAWNLFVLGSAIYCEVYDGKVWQTATVDPLSRVYHTATRLMNGDVLVVGGFYQNNQSQIVYLDQVLEFKPQDNSLIEIAPLQRGRAYHMATRLPNGNVLVVGGRDANQRLKTIE